MEHTVKVWDRSQRVTVVQRTKTVWIAVGDYQGQRLEVKGRTESQAIANWREAARYRGN